MMLIDKINSIEKQLGFELPEEYKQFLLDEASHSQYKLTWHPRILDDGFETNGGIQDITTVDTFWRDNQYREFLLEMQTDFERPASYVEAEYLYHIMGGTGAVCMAMHGRHKGKIYSVDNGDFGIIYQAENLERFLNTLYKYKP